MQFNPSVDLSGGGGGGGGDPSQQQQQPQKREAMSKFGGSGKMGGAYSSKKSPSSYGSKKGYPSKLLSLLDVPWNESDKTFNSAERWP